MTSALAAAANHAVIVKSGNMSLGVTMLAAIVAQAAKALPNFDIEIVEMHHRMKVDAPSGTALLLGEAAARARGIAPGKNIGSKAATATIWGRAKMAASALPVCGGGSLVGEHEVILAGPGEHITLSHVAEDRSIFARGALQAARWGHGQKPGLYGMTDVLGL